MEEWESWGVDFSTGFSSQTRNLWYTAHVSDQFSALVYRTRKWKFVEVLFCWRCFQFYCFFNKKITTQNINNMPRQSRSSGGSESLTLFSPFSWLIIFVMSSNWIWLWISINEVYRLLYYNLWFKLRNAYFFYCAVNFFSFYEWYSHLPHKIMNHDWRMNWYRKIKS